MKHSHAENPFTFGAEAIKKFMLSYEAAKKWDAEWERR